VWSAQDALLPKQTARQIRSVLSPKLGGTAALERALAAKPRQHTALFSSVSALLGNSGQVGRHECRRGRRSKMWLHIDRHVEWHPFPAAHLVSPSCSCVFCAVHADEKRRDRQGQLSLDHIHGACQQANYAAANAALDGWAQHAFAAGLPCVSIAWGMWTMGMAARTARFPAINPINVWCTLISGLIHAGCIDAVVESCDVQSCVSVQRLWSRQPRALITEMNRICLACRIGHLDIGSSFQQCLSVHIGH
jgi:KR domain